MKETDHLKTRKAIFITGDLASGKSTYSKYLSSMFKIAVFNKDSIKEVLGDTIGFLNREENLKLSIATIKLIEYSFEQLALVGNLIILEGNFHTDDLRNFNDIAKKHHYQTLTLVLEADVNILHKRYLNRINNEQRHKVHLSLPLDNFDAFKNYVFKSRNRITFENTVKVDAKDFSYFDNEAIIKTIKDFIEV